MALIEVKRTPEGKVLARRRDGRPLSPEDRQEAKRLAEELQPPCWNCGNIMGESKDIYGQAVFVCWSCAKWA